jgi:hypothetical protein
MSRDEIERDLGEYAHQPEVEQDKLLDEFSYLMGRYLRC